MTKKHLVVVLTEPTDGMEAEFNDYYENTHIDEVLQTTGWTRGQRFKLMAQAGSECPLPFLAVYEAEAEDAASVLKQLNDTRPQRQRTDALNRKTGRVWIFQETGPQHVN